MNKNIFYMYQILKIYTYIQEIKFVYSLAEYSSSLIVNEEVIVHSCVDWQCNESVY